MNSNIVNGSTPSAAGASRMAWLTTMFVEVAMTVTSPPNRLPKASGISSRETATRRRRPTPAQTGINVATTPVFDSTDESVPARTARRATRGRSAPRFTRRKRRPRASAMPVRPIACPKTYIEPIRMTASEANPEKACSGPRVPVKTRATTTPMATRSYRTRSRANRTRLIASRARTTTAGSRVGTNAKVGDGVQPGQAVC